MRLIQRVELHNALRRIARRSDGDKPDVLKVLGDDEALAVLEARVDRTATHAGVMTGPVQNFIQWLIDNQAAIIAFIKEIIALFGL